MAGSREPLPPELLLTTRRFSVLRHTQLFADGTVKQRESIQHPGAVLILPWFSDGRVALIRNYRVAVGETVWELPAGTLEPPEEPAATAARELQEETGYRAARLEPLGRLLMSPGILNERMHLFAATELTPGPTALEQGEEIETHLFAWEAALEMIDGGEICDAKSVAALLLWERLLRRRDSSGG